MRSKRDVRATTQAAFWETSGHARLDDQWIWDSWIADDGDLYHLFFLKAPRALGSPSERHVNATVGHATSGDLVSWDYLVIRRRNQNAARRERPRW
jgi:hypothetical protein